MICFVSTASTNHNNQARKASIDRPRRGVPHALDSGDTKSPDQHLPFFAMSSRLAFAPDRVNSCFATSRMRSRFRCASARGFLSVNSRVFVGIKKFLQPEAASVNPGTRRRPPPFVAS
jgi:hypothetical protein